MNSAVDWSETFEEFRPKIYRYFRRRIKDYALCEDLTSETFLKAIEANSQGKGATEHFSGWLFSIARNMLTDVYRKKQKYHEIPWEYAENERANGTSPNDAAERSEQIKLANAVLNRLTAKQLEVINYRYLYEMGFEQIADLMGENVNTVRALKRRGLDSAFKMLNKGNDRPVDDRGDTYNKLVDLLNHHAPMTTGEMALLVNKSHAAVSSMLFYYPNTFCKVGSRENGKVVTFLWGLVGAHQKVA